jgi:hypothetical protein
MPSVIRSSAAVPHAKGSPLRWLPLGAALIAGAALSLDFVQPNVERPAPAAPAERQAAPPAPRSAPLNQRPYIPPIRIGSNEAPALQRRFEIPPPCGGLENRRDRDLLPVLCTGRRV